MRIIRVHNTGESGRDPGPPTLSAPGRSCIQRVKSLKCCFDIRDDYGGIGFCSWPGEWCQHSCAGKHTFAGRFTFVKTYTYYQPWFSTPAHAGSGSTAPVFITLECGFCVCSTGMRVWTFEQGVINVLGWCKVSINRLTTGIEAGKRSSRRLCWVWLKLKVNLSQSRPVRRTWVLHVSCFMINKSDSCC